MWLTAHKRYVGHVLPLLLGFPSIHSLCYQKLKVAESGSALYQLCIMLAKDFIPSLQLQVKPVLCRETKGLVTELWSRKFVTQWLCSQLCYETAANEWTLVKIEILVTVGWKWGCQPFSCRSSLNVTYCRKDICSTCLSKESIPAIPLGFPSIHSLPEAGPWEQQLARPVLHFACIMPIPSLQLQKKPVLCREA